MNKCIFLKKIVQLSASWKEYGKYETTQMLDILFLYLYLDTYMTSLVFLYTV